MEIWQEIIKDRERGARELVAVYQDRLFASALILCRDRRAAEELVFRTFARAIDKISSFRPNTNFYLKNTPSKATEVSADRVTL